MKKLRIIGIMLVLAAVLAVAAYAASPELTATSDSGKPGETVEISISLSSNPGLVNLTFDMAYDESVLELVSISDKRLFGTSMFRPTELSGNPYKFTWSDMNAYDDYTVNGELVKLTFRIKETASAGKTNITLTHSAGDVFNVMFDEYTCAITNGVVTIEGNEPAKPGTKTVVTKKTGSTAFDVAVTGVAAGKKMVASAFYGDRLVCAVIRDVPADGAIKFELTQTIDQVKVMILDTLLNLKPLTECEVLDV